MKSQQFSQDVKKHMKLFASYYNKGSLSFLASKVLDKNIDYKNSLLRKGVNPTIIYTVYLNNLKIDLQGNVTNHNEALLRASEKIRTMLDLNYQANPKFQKWELELFY